MRNSNMARLFVAVDLTSEAREKLRAMCTSLRKHAPKAKWVPLEQAHVTLEFLKDWPEEQVDALRGVLRNVCASHDSFELTIEGADCFGAPSHPKVFFLGLGGALAELQRLQQDIQTALRPLGHVPEKRAFRPHLTLARAKNLKGDADLHDCVTRVPNEPIATIGVDSIILYRSTLTAGGAIHQAVESFSSAEKKGQ